ncbi:MAG: flavin reductase family protein [Ignavibacteria bacterium]
MNKKFLEFIPGEVPKREMHQILLSGVAPRPIALVSTISKDGIYNLAPYSFFNAFASNPPIVAIGPAISAATGKIKDTYTNIIETGECTINAVTYDMTEQISLASCEFPPEINEFEKSGLHPIDSHKVKAPRVMESPFQMECKLLETIALKRELGGNGNIMLLEVVKIHADKKVFTNEQIDPQKLDLVARMGYDYYCRAYGDAIFEVFKPKWNGIGIDALPEFIKQSNVLTGAQLAKLAGIKEIPQKSDVNFSLVKEELITISGMPHILDAHVTSEELEKAISTLVDQERIDLAWCLLAEYLGN